MPTFAIVFVLTLALQVLLIFFRAGLSIGGHPPLVIYAPVIEFLLPTLKAHFGGSDGSLGPIIVWGSLAGALIYSAILGGLAAFCVWWGGDAAPTRSLSHSPEIAEQKTGVSAHGTPDEKLAHLVKKPE